VLAKLKTSAVFHNPRNFQNLEGEGNKVTLRVEENHLGKKSFLLLSKNGIVYHFSLTNSAFLKDFYERREQEKSSIEHRSAFSCDRRHLAAVCR
jgi:hypothetical protein